MSLRNDQPEMGPNFWIAMILSMLVIFGYPVFMKKFYPQPVEQPAAEESLGQAPAADGPQTLPAVTGAVLEKLALPSTILEENPFYEIEFSTLGATVTRLWFKGEEPRRELTESLLYEADPATPGMFGLRLLHDREDLTQAIFQVRAREEQRTIEFVYEKTGEYRIIKKYWLEERHPVIRLSVTLENLSPYEKHFPLEFQYGLFLDSLEGMAAQHNEAVVWAGKVKSANYGKLSKKGFDSSETIGWVGAMKPYFATLVDPDWKVLTHHAEAHELRLSAAMTMEPVSVMPGSAPETRAFLIYAGPQRYETLKDINAGFEAILSKGFFGTFKIWLLVILKFFYQYTHNYGYAIILLTLLIKGVFAPLTHISYKSMKKMQAIQPKIKALQERHKKDPEKLNRETMELFKRNRVNPMAGCLPMLIQMPVLFAMFRLLPEAIELKGAPFFFWIQDLSQPDRLYNFSFTIPFLGWDSLNLLPLLMIGSQFWYQKLMPQTSASPEQAKIMSFMPVFFGFICYSMPSGLVLYWFIQNVLSIIQQVFVNRIVIALHHEDQA